LGLTRPHRKSKEPADRNEPIPGNKDGDYAVCQHFDFDAFGPRKTLSYGKVLASPSGLGSDSNAEGSTRPRPQNENSPDTQMTQKTSSPPVVWPGKIPEFDYQIADSTDIKYVDLVVPYLSYSQFQTTAVYKTGISYYSFIDMLRHHTVGYSHDLARKAAAMCEGMAKADAFLSGSEIGEEEHFQDDSFVDKMEHDGEDGNSPGIPLPRATTPDTRRPYTIKVVQGQDDSDSNSDPNSDSNTESDSYLPSDSEISSDNLYNGIALVRTEFPVWLPSRRDSPTSTKQHDYEIRHGLLNDIPGDSAIVHNGEDISLNLVSSKWLEWRDFAVYPAVSSPSIQTSQGENIKCHGYIMGTWTDTDTDTGILETRWSGLCFHVVDCVFGEEGDSDSETHNFLINENLLSDENSTTCKPLLPPSVPPYLLTS